MLLIIAVLNNILNKAVLENTTVAVVYLDNNVNLQFIIENGVKERG